MARSQTDIGSPSPERRSFVLTPERISELTGRPLAEVKADLRNSQERGVLAHKLSLIEEVKQGPYGKNVKDLERHLGQVQSTLESKKSWLGRRWENVKGLFRNKWVKRGAIVGAMVLAYLAYRNFPGWDKIQSWLNRLMGVHAAEAKDIATQAPAVAASPIVKPLVNPGNVTSGGAPLGTPFFDALQQSAEGMSGTVPMRMPVDPVMDAVDKINKIKPK